MKKQIPVIGPNDHNILWILRVITAISLTIMQKKTYHEGITPLSYEETQALVQKLRDCRTVVVDNVRLTVSEPTLEPRECAKCDLPRPCRDDSHISNICTVCLALDWSYEPRKKWRRYLIKPFLLLLLFPVSFVAFFILT
jgi:hypothetical protein